VTPNELLLPTFSTRVLNGRLVVFVCRPGRDIGDDDWQRYVEWLKALQKSSPDIGILTAPNGRAPSSTQRNLLNRELNADRIRVAVMLSDTALLPIVKVSAWFMKGIKPFGATELDKALAYLGETDVSAVRIAIRELGGALHKVAP
jgi:hypothetical protein